MRVGWLQRALVVLVGAGLALIAFFFLTVALLAAALIAIVVGIRWWWALRRLRAAAAASEAIEGEYTVIEEARSIERDVRR